MLHVLFSFKINEYIYAIEGINVLRRSGKEVERLLSMFDKCTVYTIYNRDDFRRITAPHTELNGKSDIQCSNHLLSSVNDYNSNERKTKCANVSSPSLNHMNQQHQQSSYSSSPTSSIDGSSSCSISPKHLQQYSNNAKGALTKHFPFFRLTSRSCSNTFK